MTDREERKKAALKDYECTKDILLLQKALGHKKLSSTFAFLERHKHATK